MFSVLTSVKDTCDMFIRVVAHVNYSLSRCHTRVCVDDAREHDTTALTNTSTRIYRRTAHVDECALYMHTHAMCAITMHLTPSCTPYTIECMRATHTYLLRHVQNDSDSLPKANVSS